MSIKTIVLADNSYTIRRIVELSFSEEKDIEVKSFENSLNLREKLLELRPHIVMVDIKLPEFNGYQVCKFIQESESLHHTKVFLLKGGFEPIDENMLKNLRYVEIITKPFDSIALVSKVKKLIDEMPAPASVFSAPPPQMDLEMEMPSSLPEEVPEIDALSESDSDISFSDIKDEIDSDSIMGGDEFSGSPSPYPYPDDDILPNEEITQAQGMSPDRDNLASHMVDDIDNPFADDMGMEGGSFESDSLTEEELNIKRNIEFQEKELEIGSLTMEEITIKQDIERQRRSNLTQQSLGLDDDMDMGMPDMGPEMGDDLGMDFGSNMHLRDVPEFDDEELEEESEPPLRPVADSDSKEMFPDVNLDSIDSMIGRPPSTLASRPTVEEPEPSYWTDNMKTPEAMDEDIFATTPPKSLTFDEPDSFGEAEEKLFTDEQEMPDVNYETDFGHQSRVSLEEALPTFQESERFAPPITESEPDILDSFPSQDMSMQDLEFGTEGANADEAEVNEYVMPEMESPETLKWDSYQGEPDESLEVMDEFSGFDSPDLPRFEDLPGVEVPQAPRVPLIPQAPPVTPSVQVTRTPPDTPPVVPTVQVPRTPPAPPSVPVSPPPTATPIKHEPKIPPVPPTVQVPQTPPMTSPLQEQRIPPVASSIQMPRTPPPMQEPPTPPVPPVQEQRIPAAAPSIPVPKMPPPPPPAAEPVKTTPKPPVPPMAARTPEVQEPPAATPPTATAGTVPHGEILRKIEDKLTHAIKEMLWEIVPPLAEKIIKAEIAALKEETEKSLK